MQKQLISEPSPALWYITWDATQPVATRPLAIQKDATWYTYGWDLTRDSKKERAALSNLPNQLLNIK